MSESLAGCGSGRTREFILCGLPEFWQHFKICLFRRDITQTRMNPVRVVPIHVFGNLGSGRADAVIGFELNPQALDEHVVAPGTTPVHGQRAASVKHRVIDSVR